MVDGGINEETAIEALQAGANVIVSGSTIFGKNRRASMGVGPIRSGIEKFISLVEQYGL